MMQKIKKWNTNNLGNVQGANPILKLISNNSISIWPISMHY